MCCVIIFQSTLIYLSYNVIFFNQKSTRHKVFIPKNVSVNFQLQSFDISEESIATN